MPRGLFTCSSCQELERACTITVDDYSVFPDRCMFSNGVYTAKWQRLMVEYNAKPDGVLDGPPAKEDQGER